MQITEVTDHEVAILAAEMRKLKHMPKVALQFIVIGSLQGMSFTEATTRKAETEQFTKDELIVKILRQQYGDVIIDAFVDFVKEDSPLGTAQEDVVQVSLVNDSALLDPDCDPIEDSPLVYSEMGLV